MYEKASALGEEKYRAVAVGNTWHLTTDSVKHGGSEPQHVPRVIRDSLIPNLPVHPAIESQAFSIVDRDHPDLFPRLQVVLRPFFDDSKVMQMFIDCATRQPALTNFNMRSSMEFLDATFATQGGFFTKAFALPTLYDSIVHGDLTYGLVFSLLTALFFFIFFKIENIFVRIPLAVFGTVFLILGTFFLIGGVEAFSKAPGFRADVYHVIDESKERVLFVTQPQNWNSRTNFDPTGFTELKEADASISGIYVLVGLVILSVVIFSIYKWWKNR